MALVDILVITGLVILVFMVAVIVKFNSRFNCFFWEVIFHQIRADCWFYKKVGRDMIHVGSKYVVMGQGAEDFKYRGLEYDKPYEQSLPKLNSNGEPVLADGKNVFVDLKPASVNYGGHSCFKYEIGNPVPFDKFEAGSMAEGFIVSRAGQEFEKRDAGAMKRGMDSKLGILMIILIVASAGGIGGAVFMYGQDNLHQYMLKNAVDNSSALAFKVLGYERWFADNLGRLPVILPPTQPNGTVIVP